MGSGATIRTLTRADDMERVRVLFREYAAEFAHSPGSDVCFGGFEQELAELPGPYAPPSGCLLLATARDEPAGCVALKEVSDSVCEMKRLYVRPQHRGTGLGRTLTERAIREAAHLGYQVIRLDTVPSVMGPAVALYRSLGFREVPPYCDDPVPGAVYLQLRLDATVAEDVRITPATVEDAEAILALQRLAYQTEAELYDDLSVPPLTQTLESLRAEFATKAFLKAADESHPVGSVRAFQDGQTCHVERLIVHPDRQGRGIGTALLRRVESLFPSARRFELFTGHKSLRNIRLYERLGYRVFKRQPVNEKLTLVFLEKAAGQ